MLRGKDGENGEDDREKVAEPTFRQGLTRSESSFQEDGYQSRVRGY